MDKEKLEKLRGVAKRTIKILDHIEEGTPVQTIVEKVGCNRQLVEYYVKAVSQK